MARRDMVSRLARGLFLVAVTVLSAGADRSTPPCVLDLKVLSSLPQALPAWSADTACVRVHVHPQGTDTVRVILRMILYKDSTVVAYTRARDGREVQVGMRDLSLVTRDLFLENSVEFLGSPSRTVTRLGTLRPGEYTLQCHALNPENTDEILAQSDIVSCTVQGFESPVLVEPPTYHWVSRGREVVFRWRALSPLPALPHTVRYRFLLFEVPEGTDPDGIEDRRKPLVQQWSSVGDPLTIRFKPGAGLLRVGGTYVWTVQAVDETGTPYGSNGGFAETFVFRVRK